MIGKRVRIGALSSAAALSVALGALAGCGRGDSDREKPRPVVSVFAAERRTLPQRREHVGTLRAVHQVDVRARVRGFLKQRSFEEGQLVREGEVLFAIDPSTYEVRLREAQGALARAHAAVTRARRDLERAQALFEQQAASASLLDERRAESEQARAEHQTAEAAVAAAKLDLSYCTVRAPLAGRIGRAQVDVGNLVGEGGQDTVLATIVQVDPIHVFFNPTEQDRLRGLRQGLSSQEQVGSLQVELRLGDGRLHPHRGVLDFVDSTIDETRGTISVRAVVPNPDGLLKPGEFVRVTELLPDIPDAIVVPERAIQDEQGGSFVLVVGPDEQVEHRGVEVGSIRERMVHVVSGLSAGERVIVDGAQKARPGMQVEIRAEAPQAPRTAAPPRGR
jgi:membrane fusion protein (multidrug efflux system)